MNSPTVPNEVLRLAGITAPLMRDKTDGDAADAHAGMATGIMRIQSLERSLLKNGRICNRAALFHKRGSMHVEWWTQHVDTRLQRYGLVSVRPASHVRDANGYRRIDRLLPADQPQPSVDLFETIPPDWLPERELAIRASVLWTQLPRPLAHIVNAVLWDSHRFHRFVMGPSSLQGHHNIWNGNFRHSVEVAEHAQELGRRTAMANSALLVAGGLLHDVGKADEYSYDRSRGSFRLSARGELIGHRDTLIEWIAVARQAGRVIMADDLYLALLHMLNAVRGAPSWMGVREPRSLEAEILSMADRLSGYDDLHERCAPDDGRKGFGGYHKHLGHRTYVMREAR